MEWLGSLIGSPSPSPASARLDFYLGQDSAVELPPGDISDKEFRIGINLHVLKLITAALAETGISTDQPCVNKFGLVSCSANLPTCTTGIMVGARSREKVPHFEILTLILEPRRDIPSAAFNEWRAFCDKVEEILATQLGATSIQRLAP